jgi:hypothetical protein
MQVAGRCGFITIKGVSPRNKQKHGRVAAGVFCYRTGTAAFFFFGFWSFCWLLPAASFPWRWPGRLYLISPYMGAVPVHLLSCCCLFFFLRKSLFLR